MATYQEPTARALLVAPGPYLLRVRDVEHGISTGALTRGSTLYTITFDIVGDRSWLHDRLIDSANTVWRMNAFVKALGFVIPPNTDYEIATDHSTGQCAVVPAKGHHLWAYLGIEDYVSKKGISGKKNVIDNYILAPTPQQSERLLAAEPGWGKHEVIKVEDDIPF